MLHKFPSKIFSSFPSNLAEFQSINFTSIFSHPICSSLYQHVYHFTIIILKSALLKPPSNVGVLFYSSVYHTINVICSIPLSPAISTVLDGDCERLSSISPDTVTDSDGRFPYSKSKIEIFSQNRKKSKSRFYNKLVHRFLLTWNTFIFDRDNVVTFWETGNCCRYKRQTNSR